MHPCEIGKDAWIRFVYTAVSSDEN